MSSPNALAAAAAASKFSSRYVVVDRPFEPQPLISVRIGSQYVNLHPILEADATDAEWSHSWKSNHANLCATTLAPRVIIHTLADRAGLSTNLAAHVANIKDEFKRLRSNPANMTLLSYRGRDGAEVADTLVNGALKPVQDGAAGDCRPNGVLYLTVDTNITLPNGSRMHFPQTYELPQGSRNVTRANNHQATISGYVGDDPMQMSYENFMASIVEPSGYLHPCRLEEPAYGTNIARIDATNLADECESKLFRLNFDDLCDLLFNDLCPNYSRDPCASLQEVHQVTADGKGNTVVKTVKQYTASFRMAMRPVAEKNPAPINYAQQYISRLEPTLRKQVEANFTRYRTETNMARQVQLKLLSEAVQAAEKCDTEHSAVEQIVLRSQRESTSMMAEAVSQFCGFHLTADQHTQIRTGDNPAKALTTALMSQAERTIRANESKPAASANWWEIRACWGCGGDHQYNERQPNEEYLTLCPRANEPAVADLFEQRRKEYPAKRKLLRAAKRRAARGGSSSNKKAKVSLATRTAIAESIKTAMAAASAASVASQVTTESGTVAAGTAAASVAGSGATTGFQIGALLAHSAVPSSYSAITAATRMLPVPVSPKLPHIAFALGLPGMPEEIVPSMLGMIDSCAALCTCKLSVMLDILQRYPNLAKTIIDCKDGKYLQVLHGVLIGQKDYQ